MFKRESCGEKIGSKLLDQSFPVDHQFLLNSSYTNYLFVFIIGTLRALGELAEYTHAGYIQSV